MKIKCPYTNKSSTCVFSMHSGVNEFYDNKVSALQKELDVLKQRADSRLMSPEDSRQAKKVRRRYRDSDDEEESSSDSVESSSSDNNSSDAQGQDDDSVIVLDQEVIEIDDSSSDDSSSDDSSSDDSSSDDSSSDDGELMMPMNQKTMKVKADNQMM